MDDFAYLFKKFIHKSYTIGVLKTTGILYQLTLLYV